MKDLKRRFYMLDYWDFQIMRIKWFCYGFILMLILTVLDSIIVFRF